jgi:hypothetical protein
MGRIYNNENSSGQGFILQGTTSDDVCSDNNHNYICQGKFKITYVKVSLKQHMSR